MQIPERLKQPIKTLIIVAVFILVLSTLVPRCRELFSLHVRKQELQTQISELQQKQQELEQEKAAMNTPEATERIAREQLGMIKEGEKVLVEVESP